MEKNPKHTITWDLHSIMLKNKFRNGIMYKKTLLSFMDKYHIEDKHEDALMKAFQRWKKKTEEERKKRMDENMVTQR